MFIYLPFVANQNPDDWAGLFWNPPRYVLEVQYRKLEKKYLKPSQWDLNFRQTLSFTETVLDYLRKRGTNASFVLRLTLDRYSMKEPERILPDSWKEDLNINYNCHHFLYNGECIFYGVQTVNDETRVGRD